MNASQPLIIHPAAEAYRRMTEEELASLAADIAENGQHDPVVLGRIKGSTEQHQIIDGRNRVKACEIAGTVSKFETREFESEEAIRSFVKSRSERRDLSKGQRAIGHALLVPNPEQGGRGRKKERVDETSTFSAKRLQHARLILHHSRDLALAVRDGSIKFDEALTQVQNATNALKSAEAKLARIQTEDPDLAALVTEERLSLDEAIKTLDNRVVETKRQQETATRVLQSIFNALFPRGATPAEWAERISGDAREEFWSGADELTFKNLCACADVMRAISNRWKHTNG